MTSRGNVASVEARNLKLWMCYFLEDIRTLWIGNQKMLIIYNAFKAHVFIAVIEKFTKAGMIMFALPFHTSCKTQPLDVGEFCIFKRQFWFMVYIFVRSSKTDISCIDNFGATRLITKA